MLLFRTLRERAFRVHLGPDYRARDGRKVRMVSEEQYLRRFGEVGQHLKSSSGALIVEVDEEVVRQEREPHSGGDRLLDSREAQREEQLIRRALAHRAHLHDSSTVVSQPKQARCRPFGVDPQCRVPSDRERREKLGTHINVLSDEGYGVMRAWRAPLPV